MGNALDNARPDSFGQYAVIALAILTILYVMFRPKLKKKDPLERPPRMNLSRQRDVERQMESLLVELSEMARQITAQLDTRSAKLQMLVTEADQKIAELNALSARAENRGEAPVSAAASAALTELLQPAAATPLRPPMTDDRHAQVYRLADQGRDAQQIARELGRPSGEIELILALRQQA